VRAGGVEALSLREDGLGEPLYKGSMNRWVCEELGGGKRTGSVEGVGPRTRGGASFAVDVYLHTLPSSNPPVLVSSRASVRRCRDTCTEAALSTLHFVFSFPPASLEHCGALARHPLVPRARASFLHVFLPELRTPHGPPLPIFYQLLMCAFALDPSNRDAISLRQPSIVPCHPCLILKLISDRRRGRAALHTAWARSQR
jgi:hypothetical protein